MRPLFLLAFAGLIAVWCGDGVAAREPTAIDGVVYPDDPWTFHIGDEVRGADPQLDDSGWARVPAGTRWSSLNPRPAGYAWYRMRVAVASDQPIAVGLARVYDAAELYVDGRLLAQHGDPDHQVAGRRIPFQAPVPLELTADGEILIAVRVWGGLDPDIDGWISAPMIGPARGLADTAAAIVHGYWRHPQGVPTLFFGLMLIGLGIVHTVFYLSRRDADQGLFALASYGLGLAHIWKASIWMGLLTPTWHYVPGRTALRFASYAVYLLYTQRLFGWPWPNVTRGVAVICVLAIVMAGARIGSWGVSIHAAHASVALLGAAMLTYGLVKRSSGAAVLTFGFLPMVVSGALDAYSSLIGPVGNYASWRTPLLVIGLGTVPFSVSVALAARFAGTLNELDRTYRASFRFVPVAFLELLGRKTVTETERGDHARKDQTVMFCDIRGFTTLSESRTSGESFDFINRFLAAMEPTIHRFGGFVVTYLGDGFMALFPKDGEAQPVRAAVEIQKRLQRFNEDEVALGEPSIQVGIGLHSGKVMLGTIGGKERLYTGVVSDVVNTASRVEGLSKLYGAPVVISEATRDTLTSDPFTLHELDSVIVKGRDTPLRIFEVLEGERDHRARRGKARDQKHFEAALAAYRGGDIATARSGFESLSQGRTAATLFLERCALLEKNGLPEDWDGVIRLTVK